MQQRWQANVHKPPVNAQTTEYKQLLLDRNLPQTVQLMVQELIN